MRLTSRCGGRYTGIRWLLATLRHRVPRGVRVRPRRRRGSSRESVCKYSLLKALVLSAVHTASEAAGPAPRGSESRTRSIIAQHDPHLAKAESLPVAPGQLRYSAPICILPLLSGLQRKGTHPRQLPGSNSCRGMHRCWLCALILRFLMRSVMATKHII